jgi:hypothetical protein
LSVAASAQTSIPLSTAFQFPEKGVPLHGLLKASFSITNGSSDSYTVDLGLDNIQAITLTVTDPDGAISKITPPLSEGLHTPGTVHIQGKATYIQDVILSRWLQFDKTGVYRISLAINAPVTDGLPGTLTAKSDNEDILVSEPDANYLKRQCGQLVQTIISTTSSNAAIEAAKNLDAIHDPIAVSYLIRAAEGRPAIGYIPIEGLERLGTGDAVDGLLTLSKSQDAETKALALRSLGVLERSENDPSIRRRIQTGLADGDSH